MTLSKLRPKRRLKMAAEDEEQVLLRAILKLPTCLRDVFLLHRMAGMTYSEIGLHLGMTQETVQASLAAALLRLTRAVPTCDPSLDIKRGSEGHRDKPERDLEARHSFATRLSRVCFLRNRRLEITTDQNRSKVSNPHAGERNVHNLGRRNRGLTAPEQP